VVKESKFYKKLDNNKVQVMILADRPILDNGDNDSGGVSLNLDGKLVSLNYGMIISTKIVEDRLIVALLGNNQRPTFDKYWSISQFPVISQKEYGRERTNQKVESIGTYISPEVLIAYASNRGLTISFEIGEPSVNFDYISSVAKLASEKDVKISILTNGSFDIDTFRGYMPLFDTIEISLHSMQSFFYKKHCKYDIRYIRSFIEFLSDEYDGDIILQTVLIPEENNTPYDIQLFTTFIKGLKRDVKWMLIPFTPSYKILDKNSATREDLDLFQAKSSLYGISPILI
jgi:pyruvate-formate lyase-activating enzyme